MASNPTNGFGSNTYWNQPTSRSRTRRPTRSLSPTNRQIMNTGPTPTAQHLNTGPTPTAQHMNTGPTPTAQAQASSSANGTNLQRSPKVSQTFQPPTSSTRHKSPSLDMSQYNTHMQALSAALDKKDEAAMVKLMKSTLPLFSNEHDWEMASFELALILDRVWPHRKAMDICQYLQTDYPHYDRDMEMRADSLIYFALTLAAKNGSFAKLQILAACHKDAIPCVMRNEGRKLYQMFQSLFTMTTLHTANLPGVRKQFYDISQTTTETVLEYSSRVDIIVATMAKLGEQVSPGAWIYALGHGLRQEYKDTKDGILYNRNGYSTVLSVKTKILSEEAILKDKRAEFKKEQQTQQALSDEIAMKIAASQPVVAVAAKPNNDTAHFTKGKGGNTGSPKGQRQWVDEQWTQWQPTWSPPTVNPQWQPSSPKGKGKQQTKPKQWCDIHQAYGHSTD